MAPAQEGGPSSHGFHHITYQKPHGLWLGQVGWKGSLLRTKYYKDPEAAAHAVDRCAFATLRRFRQYKETAGSATTAALGRSTV